MRTLTLGLIACLVATPGVAQQSNPWLLDKYFGPDTQISVVFDDQVRDGCLPRPAAVQTAMELGLRRARLTVNESSEGTWVLSVVAFGYEERYRGGEASGDCNVVISSSLLFTYLYIDGIKYMIDQEDIDYVTITTPVLISQILLNGQKSGMQDRVRSSVVETVDEFANEILKAAGS